MWCMIDRVYNSVCVYNEAMNEVRHMLDLCSRDKRPFEVKEQSVEVEVLILHC